MTNASSSPASASCPAPDKPKPPSEPVRSWYGLSAVALGLLLWSLLPPAGPVRESARRSVASSNLRQIGQASLIYASEHEDRLPQAADIWGYAEQLAKDGGLNDAGIWATGTDPANEEAAARLTTVLTADRSAVAPEFLKLKPSWAVPLGELTAAMPSTVPIAWTRGLRADGTWSPHSPYGTEGGHVVFLGGNVAYYRNTRDAFVRFAGKGPTSNILEALPPGTRVGEYVPDEAEQRAWERARFLKKVRPLVFPSAWLAVFMVFTVQALRRKWPVSHLIWFLLLSLLVASAASLVC